MSVAHSGSSACLEPSQAGVQCRAYSVGCAAAVAEGRRICFGDGAVVFRNGGRRLQWGILNCEKEGMG
jgi:hypothetical protein